MKSAVQTRVVLLIKPRLHATYTLYSLLLNYKLEAAGESWPNFLRTVIRKWGYCTVNSGKNCCITRRIINEVKYLFSSVRTTTVSRKLVERDIHIYILIYLLTPWSRVLLEKLTGFQLVRKFPAFYGTRMFITAVTSARHLSLSWASSIQSIPRHTTSWKSILIFSSHLRLGLPSGIVERDNQAQMQYSHF